MTKIILFLTLITFNLYANPPFWINNPTNNNFIGEVGIVKDKTQRRLATMKARASLLESIQVHISSTLKLDEICTNDKCKENFQQKILQEAKGCLKNSFVKDTYSDKDNYFYIWVVIKNKFDKDSKCED